MLCGVLGVLWRGFRAHLAEQGRLVGLPHCPWPLSTRGALLLFALFAYLSWYCFLLESVLGLKEQFESSWSYWPPSFCKCAQWDSREVSCPSCWARATWVFTESWPNAYVELLLQFCLVSIPSRNDPEWAPHSSADTSVKEARLPGLNMLRGHCILNLTGLIVKILHFCFLEKYSWNRFMLDSVGSHRGSLASQEPKLTQQGIHSGTTVHFPGMLGWQLQWPPKDPR